jgi:hypothetical protein
MVVFCIYVCEISIGPFMPGHDVLYLDLCRYIDGRVNCKMYDRYIIHLKMPKAPDDASKIDPQ